MRYWIQRDGTHGKQFTLGGLIDALEKIDGAKLVMFDFGGMYPTQVESWRGSYDECALGFTSSEDRYQSRASETVGALVRALKDAVGNTYGGWKGGEYTMERETPLWVDNRGNSSCTIIDGIEHGESSFVYLLTSHVEY